MKRELTPREIIYNTSFLVEEKLNKENILECNNVYKTIKEALNIDKEGFNVYLVDSFSNKKIKEMVESISTIMLEREKPNDICYATLDNEREPRF